jgi:hypothetical protein
MMRLPKFVPQKKPHSTGRHVLEGFRYVAGHRRVCILLLLFGVVGIFGWSYAVLLPVYATDILYVGESGYGVLLSANGFGALFWALTVATYGSRVRPRLMSLAGAIYGHHREGCCPLRRFLCWRTKWNHSARGLSNAVGATSQHRCHRRNSALGSAG